LARLEQTAGCALDLRARDGALQRMLVDDDLLFLRTARCPTPWRARGAELANRLDGRLQLVAENRFEMRESFESGDAREAVDRRNRRAGERRDLLGAVRQRANRMRGDPPSHARQRGRGIGHGSFDTVLGP
jgi:hypothetical protein